MFNYHIGRLSCGLLNAMLDAAALYGTLAVFPAAHVTDEAARDPAETIERNRRAKL